MLDMCAGERPRERMIAQGAGVLSDSELLAVIIRNGTRGQSALDLARGILSECGWRLSELSSVSLARISKIQGVGPCKAASIFAALELGRRFIREENSSAPMKTVTGPESVYEIMVPELKGLKHEECWTVFLDAGNRFLSSEKLSSGGLESTVIDCRMIIRKMMEKNASGLVLVHNHPGGDPHPSAQDIKSTASLRDAVSACSLRLVDHLIFCDSCWYSFAEDR